MGLFKRGSTWWMRFSYKGKQIRKSTDSSDKKLAERIYHKVLGEIAEGKWFERLPGEEKTFGEMMTKYLEEHVCQKASARQYRGYIKNLLKFFGDSYVTEITPPTINEYKIKRRKDGVGPASINRELATLKNVFNKALKEWGWIRENPVTKIPMEKEPPGRVRYLDDEEFEELHSACSDWLKPIVMVARHTGMRKENILALGWVQVDLVRGEIILEHTKNGERLVIPLNDTMMELFKRLSKVRHIRSPYVFCKANGERYVEIKSGFLAALEKAGTEDFRFHDLRHCYASALIQRGQSLYTVQRLLGHKSPRMTQRYAHLTPDNLRDAVRSLDKKEPRKEFSTNLAQSEKERVSQIG
jgi:integrase